MFPATRDADGPRLWRASDQSPTLKAASEIVNVIQSWLRIKLRGVSAMPSWAISSASRVRPERISMSARFE